MHTASDAQLHAQTRQCIKILPGEATCFSNCAQCFGARFSFGFKDLANLVVRDEKSAAILPALAWAVQQPIPTYFLRTLLGEMVRLGERSNIKENA